MSTGSQQATKAATQHTHNDRCLSECFKNNVLCRPIFSIGQCCINIVLLQIKLFLLSIFKTLHRK